MGDIAAAIANTNDDPKVIVLADSNGNKYSLTNLFPTQSSPNADPTNQIDANGVATAGALSVTLSALAGNFTYLDGFELTVAPGTVGGSAELSVAGGIGGPWLYEIVSTVAGGQDYSFQFPKGRKTTAVNTAFVITMPSLGATTGKVSCAAHGHYSAT